MLTCLRDLSCQPLIQLLELGDGQRHCLFLPVRMFFAKALQYRAYQRGFGRVWEPLIPMPACQRRQALLQGGARQPFGMIGQRYRRLPVKSRLRSPQNARLRIGSCVGCCRGSPPERTDQSSLGVPASFDVGNAAIASVNQRSTDSHTASLSAFETIFVNVLAMASRTC